MTHEFCINCGGKNSFAETRPKFCNSCGNPFNRTDASPNEPKAEGSNLEKLEVDIIGVGNLAPSTLKSVILDNPQPKSNLGSRPDSTKGVDPIQASLDRCKNVKESKSIE